MNFQHRTVMMNEVLDALTPRSGGVYADITLGGGGHAEAILEQSTPDGRLVGLDRDPMALDAAKVRLSRFGKRVTFVHATFGKLTEVLYESGFHEVDGIVADLGVSSPQLDHAERGFSFRFSGPLDMRMDPTQGMTAKELISSLDADELATLIFELGEERRSRPIARSIKQAESEGKLNTTDDLSRAVHRVFHKRGRIDSATRTFQALRIAVNRELDELRAFLDQAADRLVDNGVVVVISFHSLEDRIVKHMFRDDERLHALSKKPLRASDEEQNENPRARSAKLRAARRRVREREIL